VVKPSDQRGTREKILAAAGELIVEVGWADTTTRGISERAGVNNALIHYYFGSKDDLLLEAAAAAFAEEVEGPLSMLTGAASVADALKDVFAWLASVDTHSPTMIIFMEAAHRAARDEKIAEFLMGVWNGFMDLLASLIARGQETGEVRTDLDPMAVATVFAALQDGLFLYRFVSSDVDPAGVPAVVEAFIDSIAKEQQ
jgi:AcrR family transcriptional regulator